MGNISPKMMALGVAGALIYVSMEGFIGNKAVNTSLMAIGSVIAAKQIPVVNQYI